MSQEEVPIRICAKCGSPVEAGFTTSEGLIGGDRTEDRRSQLLFVVPGTPPSKNPIKAFMRGLADEPGNRYHRIDGFRCIRCGFVEFYAVKR
jgi:hypothetical protein